MLSGLGQEVQHLPASRGADVRRWWRVLAKALGSKGHPDDRLADQIATLRALILLGYMTTNLFICAGVIRHWNN